MALDGTEKEAGEPKPAPNTIRTGVKNNTVIMEFAESVRGIYMSPLEAMVIAKNLLDAAITIIENPTRIIRPS